MKPHILNQSSLFTGYRYEITGLDLGLKKASIIYADKHEYKRYIRELEEHGYFYEVSDYSYLKGKGNMINPIDRGGRNIYVSTNKETCQRLKYIHYYILSGENEPSGKSFGELFLEEGKLLGYPECCSQSMLDRQNTEFKQIQSETGFNAESIYLLMGLKNSSKMCHQLNNFSGPSSPSFFRFYVCSYDCKNALSIANRLLAHIEKNQPAYYARLVEELKTPLLFFSANKVIFLLGLAKNNNRADYSSCYYKEELLNMKNYVGKEEKADFMKKLKMFSEEGSFEIDDDRIVIYNGNNPIHCIKKAHRYDGILVELE